jgi:NADH dehydrogenase/NADH:ubiquinone oxidoreductase subunit G
MFLGIRRNIFNRIGALTSKPYAFIARPWELEKINVVDYFDSFGSSATVELRGFDLVRILPRINNRVNEEWLTDRARFYFDGLRYQRLLFPLLKKEFGFVPVSWFFVRNFFLNLFRITSKKLFNGDLYPSLFFNFMVGEADDIFRQMSLKVIVQRFGNFSFYSQLQSNSIFNCIDSMDHFFLPSVEVLEDAGLVVVAGFDLRFELPLLLVKIRSLIEKNNLKVIFFGANSANLNIKHLYGGSSYKDFLSFFLGKHPLSRRFLFELKKIFCFVSFEFSQKIDLLMTENFFMSKVNFVTVFPHLGLTKLNQAILGLFNTFKTLNWNRENNYVGGLLNLTLISSNNEFKLSPSLLKSSFLVYIGSHGDFSSANSDMILPGSLLYERVNYYLNMFYQYQISSFVYAPKYSVRDSLFFFFFLNKIFFSEFINVYDTSKDFLNQFLFAQLGLRGVCDFFNTNIFRLGHLGNFTDKRFLSVSFNYFSYFLSNSYIVDSYSKNSRVLSVAALEHARNFSGIYNF